MPITECELAFARAMLADPHDAARRLVYADWLEECGDARAALVRAAEGWVVELEVREIRLIDEAGCRFSVWAHESPNYWPSCVAAIAHWKLSVGWDVYYVDRFGVSIEGTSPDNPHNWAWLLSLAIARGLVIPGLAGNRGNPPDGY